MNRAIISASIRSVFARVPRESAKALICAGGQLACIDPRRNKRGPENPFLTTAVREIDPPDRFLFLTALKPDLDRARHLPDRRDQQFVALC
jgi:hypothetical protein